MLKFAYKASYRGKMLPSVLYTFLTFLFEARSSFILPVIYQFNSPIGSYSEKTLAAVLFGIGVYLSFAGSRFKNVSFFLLMIIALNFLLIGAIDYIEKCVKEKAYVIHLISHKYFAWLKDLMDNHRTKVFIGILIFALASAYMLAAFLRATSIVFFIVICSYVYKENMHAEAAIRFGLNHHPMMAKILFGIFCVGMFVLLKRIAEMFYCLTFSLIGTIMIAIAIEIFLNKDFGFRKPVFVKNSNELTNVNFKPLCTLAISFICCFGFQYRNTSVKKRR